MRWPVTSSSEDSKSEESSSLSFATGGGEAGRLRRFALPFAPRFLKIATGAMGAVEVAVVASGAVGAAGDCSVSAIVEFRDGRVRMSGAANSTKIEK